MGFTNTKQNLGALHKVHHFHLINNQIHTSYVEKDQKKTLMESKKPHSLCWRRRLLPSPPTQAEFPWSLTPAAPGRALPSPAGGRPSLAGCPRSSYPAWVLSALRWDHSNALGHLLALPVRVNETTFTGIPPSAEFLLGYPNL